MAEKDSGCLSQPSPAPSQMKLPVSPFENPTVSTLKSPKAPSIQNTPPRVAFSQPHEIFNDLADFNEEDTLLDEDTTICESDDESVKNEQVSPPKTFIETQNLHENISPPKTFAETQVYGTQGSFFTQIMKAKKPNFQKIDDEEILKLNADYEHDKAIHKKKFDLVMKQLGTRNVRYYVYNPMLRDTRPWDSQTKNGYYDGPSSQKSEKSEKTVSSQGVQTSQNISTQIDSDSSPLPAPIFDVNTPTCSQLTNNGEQDARSSGNTETQIYNENARYRLCPPTPPNDFLNSPRQSRHYTTNTQVNKSEEVKVHGNSQVKRKEPEQDDSKENVVAEKEENEVNSYGFYSPYYAHKKPKYKQGSGLRKRVSKSLHFKIVKK